MPTILDLLGIDCDPKKFNDRSIYRDEMNDGIVMAMGSNNQVAALVGEKLKLKFKYLLLFGGLGSYWSRRIRDERWASQAVGCLFVLLCALAAGILFPIGVFMGTAVSAGHEGGSREIALLNAVAVGNQWRHIGLCFGGGRDHLFGGRNIGVVLGRVGVFPSRVLAAIWMGRWMTRGSMMEMEGA